MRTVPEGAAVRMASNNREVHKVAAELVLEVGVLLVFRIIGAGEEAGEVEAEEGEEAVAAADMVASWVMSATGEVCLEGVGLAQLLTKMTAHTCNLVGSALVTVVEHRHVM